MPGAGRTKTKCVTQTEKKGSEAYWNRAAAEVGFRGEVER
jgi:hypothetical protein